MTRRLLTSVVDEVCCLVSSGCIVVASVLRLAPIAPLSETLTCALRSCINYLFSTMSDVDA